MKFQRTFFSIPWVTGTLLVCALVCYPLVSIVTELFQPASDGWRQISETDPGGMLAEHGLGEEIPAHSRLYFRTQSTLAMLFGVGGVSLLLGVTLAWVVSMWAFPLSKALDLLLVFPLAIPSYIHATAYKLLTVDAKNAIAVHFRSRYGGEAMQEMDRYWNLSLAILVLTASFYPYVYIAARTAFSTLSAQYVETSRSLGMSAWQTFRRIALPLARPAIIGGLMLVCLETLNEYGAMKILGVNTLTTEIFYAWTNLGDKEAAIRVAGCIMLIVLAILVGEQFLRGGRRFHASRSASTELKRQSLPLPGALLALAFCGLVFGLCFALPGYKILALALSALPSTPISHFSTEIISSLWLAAKASLVIMGITLFLAYANRLVPHWGMVVLNKTSSLGYAIPGAILGVSLITLAATLKNTTASHPWVNFLFYGSTAGLVIAYAVRFLTIGLNPVEAALKNIRPDLDEASALLRRNAVSTFLRIHLPMLKYAVSGGLLVLFIDILKELPLTLIMNPSNHETLATRTYSLFAVEERYAAGSIPATILISTGMVGILVIRLLFKRLKN